MSDEARPVKAILDRRQTPHEQVQRFYQERGEALEDFRFMTAWVNDRRYFVYEIRVRWPVSHAKQFFVVVKAATPDGPVVLFHSDNGLVNTLLGVAGRLRAGQGRWKEDEWVSEKYPEYVAYITERYPGWTET